MDDAAAETTAAADPTTNVSPPIEQDAPAEAREPAPSHEQVLTEQLKDAHERIAMLSKRLAEVLPGSTQRNREIALDSALRHHSKGETSCQDKTVVISAAAYFAWLESGTAVS